MPSPNHYFQFRHRDWISSSTVRRMSLAERGAYIELLSYQWEDGFIPDDIEELSRMIGVSLADFRKLWPRLEQSFPLAEIGKRVNPVMEKDRIEAERKRDQLIQNGTKGGRPKKPKEKQTEKQKETKQKPNGFLLLNQNESKSKAIPDTDTDTYTVTKVTDTTPEDHWQEFVSAYPKRLGDLGKSKGREKFFRLLRDRVEPETIISGARRYREFLVATGKNGTEYVKQIPTFLNSKAWEEEFDVDVGLPKKPQAIDHLERIRHEREAREARLSCQN